MEAFCLTVVDSQSYNSINNRCLTPRENVCTAVSHEIKQINIFNAQTNVTVDETFGGVVCCLLVIIYR
jgi:hypothetical protein